MMEMSQLDGNDMEGEKPKGVWKVKIHSWRGWSLQNPDPPAVFHLS